MTNSKPKKRDMPSREDFFEEICFKGSQDIREVLKITEESYGFVHHRNIQKSRNYFLYGAMNEVEKVGIVILNGRELLEGEDIVLEDRVSKNIILAIQEEQYLWIRKMTELLAELILFKNTNEDPYYQHYMLVRELKELNAARRNAKEAYGCDIQNYSMQAKMLREEIADLEATKVDIQKCWYLSSKKGIATSGTKGRLAPLDKRIKAAFDLATPDQIIALGTSYGEGYSNFSDAMHFSPITRRERTVSPEILRVNTSGLSILAANIIIQSRSLLKDRRKKGYAAFLNKVFKESDQAKGALKRKLNPSIKKGDFVNAQGDLAEVTKVMKGKYGFRSFRVRFLLKEDTQTAGKGKAKTVWTHKNPKFEEYPSMWVRKLYSGKDLVESVRKEILKNTPDADVSSKRIMPFVRDSIKHMWENVGLKESVHGKKEEALEKMGQEIERIKKAVPGEEEKTT